MKLIRKPNLKSVFIVSLASYILIISMALLIGGVGYSKATSALEEEAFRANMAILEKARFLIDNKINEVNQLTSQIASNLRISSFMSINAPTDGLTRYNILFILKDMATYQSMYPFIYDYYIYFKKSDTILTPTSIYWPELFYDNVYNYNDMDIGQWRSSVLSGYHNNNYIYSQSMNISPSLESMTTYTQSLPLYERHNPLATLVILIDEQRIRDLLNSLNWLNNGSMYIVDKEGQIIFSNGEYSSVIPPISNQFVEKDGWFYLDVKGEKLAISYSSSQCQDWKYVSVMPRALFMSRVTYVQKVRNYTIVIIMILAVSLASFLAYKNYSPIKNIVNMISLKNKDASSKNFNELDYIQKNIVKTWEEDKRVRGLLNDQKGIIKINLLMRILEGKKIFPSVNQGKLDAFDIKFPYGNFLVILFSIGNIEGYITEYDEEDLTIVKLRIVEFINDIIKFTDIFYTLEVDNNKIIVLLNLPYGSIDRYVNDIGNMAKLVCNFVNSRFGIFCRSGVGSMYKGIGNVSKTYSESNRALQYKLVGADEPVVWYQDIVQSDQRYYYPVEIEQQIINHIKIGNNKQLEKLINYVFEENQVKRQLSLRMIEFLFMDLINTVIKVTDELNIDYKDVFNNNVDPIDQLLACETIDKMHNELAMLIKDVCEYINNNKKSHNDWLCEQVIQYINSKYNNQEITLTSIANKFNITPQYLSRFFKEQMGETIIEYLYKIRIHKAKQLLVEPGFSVEDVARNVGYANGRALIRAFKKYVGTTPGDFRSNFQQNVVTMDLIGNNFYNN